MQIDYQLSIISIFFSFIFYFATQKIFLNNGFIDGITKRSSHSVTSTRSGGIAIFSCLFLISFYYYIIGATLYDYSVLVPLGLLLIIGLYDDIYKIDFKLKFIFQIIAAKIIIDNGLIVDNLHGFMGIEELNRFIAQVFTLFIILAIINSINFIDGIDGLASSIMVLFIVLFEFFSNSSSPFFKLSIITVSSILPIFYFNFRKNQKIFLGDAGSLFLGGIASVYIVFILSNNYIIKPEYDLHKLLFVVLIFLYPIVDITRITIRRLYMGKSPFIADKNHIHHILLKSLNNNHLAVTLIILLFSLLTILTAYYLII